MRDGVCVCIICTYVPMYVHSTIALVNTNCYVPSYAAGVPEIMTTLVNTTLAQGGSHMFVCAAVADPRPVFTFRFNGERITTNNSKYALVTNSTHGTLTVLNLEGSDEGTYTCSASNRYGSASTSAVLTVQGVFGLGFGDWICVAFW